MSNLYTFDDAELLKQTNYTLGAVVDGLRREGFLTQDQANQIHTNYSIIIESKNWLPEFLTKWMRMKDTTLKIRLVKAIGREEYKE